MNNQRSLLQYHNWGVLEQGTEPPTAPRALEHGCPLFRVCVHLGWVKCREYISLLDIYSLYNRVCDKYNNSIFSIFYIPVHTRIYISEPNAGNGPSFYSYNCIIFYFIYNIIFLKIYFIQIYYIILFIIILLFISYKILYILIFISLLFKQRQTYYYYYHY